MERSSILTLLVTTNLNTLHVRRHTQVRTIFSPSYTNIIYTTYIGNKALYRHFRWISVTPLHNGNEWHRTKVQPSSACLLHPHITGDVAVPMNINHPLAYVEQEWGERKINVSCLKGWELIFYLSIFLKILPSSASQNMISGVTTLLHPVHCIFTGLHNLYCLPNCVRTII